MSHLYEYDDTNIVYELDDVVSFQWFKNSHCVGARQLQLILTDNIGVKHSVLYTSDIGALNSDNHYVENTEIPNVHTNVSISECTYGEKTRQNKKVESLM